MVTDENSGCLDRLRAHQHKITVQGSNGRSKHIKCSKDRYLLGQKTTCQFSGQSPLSSYKTTLKQQLKGDKWDVGLRHVSVADRRRAEVICSEIKQDTAEETLPLIMFDSWVLIVDFIFVSTREKIAVSLLTIRLRGLRETTLLQWYLWWVWRLFWGESTCTTAWLF